MNENQNSKNNKIKQYDEFSEESDRDSSIDNKENELEQLKQQVMHANQDSSYNSIEKQIKLIELMSKPFKSPDELYEIQQFIVKIDFLNKFIGANNPDLIEICKHLQLKFCPKGTTIFSEGEMGNNFFIIISGSVAISIRVPSPDNPQTFINKVIVQLKSGSAFGELALLFSSVRRATASCEENSYFMVLHQEHFQKYMKFKTNKNSSVILDFFNKLDFFKKFQLDLPRKIQIVAKTELKEYVSNAAIIKQGEDCEKLFFIKKGVVKVYRKLLFKTKPKTGELLLKSYGEPTNEDIMKGNYKEIQLEIDELYEECVFPEYEFIHVSTHKYTVITYTPCEILVISYKDIDIFTQEQFEDMRNNSKNYPPDEKLRKVYLDGQQWKKFRSTLLLTIQSDSNMKRKVTGDAAIFNRDIILSSAQPTLELNFSDDSFTKDEEEQNENKMEQEIQHFLQRDNVIKDENQEKNKKKNSENQDFHIQKNDSHFKKKIINKQQLNQQAKVKNELQNKSQMNQKETEKNNQQQIKKNQQIKESQILNNKKSIKIVDNYQKDGTKTSQYAFKKSVPISNKETFINNQKIPQQQYENQNNLQISIPLQTPQKQHQCIQESFSNQFNSQLQQLQGKFSADIFKISEKHQMGFPSNRNLQLFQQQNQSYHQSQQNNNQKKQQQQQINLPTIVSPKGTIQNSKNYAFFSATPMTGGLSQSHEKNLSNSKNIAISPKKQQIQLKQAQEYQKLLDKFQADYNPKYDTTYQYQNPNQKQLMKHKYSNSQKKIYPKIDSSLLNSINQKDILISTNKNQLIQNKNKQKKYASLKESDQFLKSFIEK